jgi:pimeloyl-ACP methyl ester carboxylesterase
MRMRALIGATLLAWVALPALALVALADEDPPLRPVDAGPPLRPPLTVLRSVERVPSASAAPNRPQKELIVLVGGYASEEESHVFDAFRARARAGGYDVVEFGRDVGTYDTFGAIDASAVQLRDTVRTLSTGYGGVHLVTHSMGGNVADRAFDLGLSSSDGVTTYVAWATPHDGVHAARQAQGWLTASGPAREDTRAFAKALLRDPDTAAVRDMARLHASAPPPGVVRLDLRLATDGLVSTADARDPGVASRVLLPISPNEVEGHGGILQSEQAFDLTFATIRSRAVPPDERGLALRAAADMLAQTTDLQAQVVFTAICVVCLIGGIGGLIRRTLRRAPQWPPISE